MNDRQIAMAGLIVGGLATIAATAQSYVAWNARDDFREAILLTEVVERCAEAVRMIHLIPENVTQEDADAIINQVHLLSVLARQLNPETAEDLKEAAHYGFEHPDLPEGVTPAVPKVAALIGVLKIRLDRACDSLLK